MNKYAISYQSTSWCVSYGMYKYTIPYTFANTLGLYVLSNYILIKLEDETIKVYQQLNITISTSVPPSELPDLMDDRETVVIATEGNWDKRISRNAQKIYIFPEMRKK